MDNIRHLALVLTCICSLTLITPASAQQAQSSGTQSKGTAKKDAQAPTKATKTPDVIFVPTPQAAVDKMLELAELKPGDVLYDLGCGDGRIVVTAAKKYGVKAVGFDVDPQRIKESMENVRTNNVGHLVTIKQEDIFTLDLSEANVVTLYLLESLNSKLVPQIEKMKPGSRIVSYSFNMPGMVPAEKLETPHTIYKWVTPLQRYSSTYSTK